MNKTKVPPSERIAVSYQDLSAASSDLNLAAKELAASISTLDAALHSLNLGVSAWYQVAGHEDQSGSYWSRDIGYANVRKKWGIALRKMQGHYGSDDHHEESWLFGDAPRWMCIESAGKIPDLFEELIKRTKEATDKLKARTTLTKELVAAIVALAPEAPQKGK